MSEKFKAGDIVIHRYNRGSELGFFRVLRTGKGKLCSWSSETDIVFCILAAHNDGTLPKSKNLKERKYQSDFLTHVSPETIEISKTQAMTYAKQRLKDAEEDWNRILDNLFPDSPKEEEVPEEIEKDFFSPLSGNGTGLLRRQE